MEVIKTGMLKYKVLLAGAILIGLASSHNLVKADVFNTVNQENLALDLLKTNYSITTQAGVILSADTKTSYTVIDIKNNGTYLGSVLDTGVVTDTAKPIILTKTPINQSDKYLYSYNQVSNRFTDVSGKLYSDQSQFEITSDTDTIYLLTNIQLPESMLIKDGWNVNGQKAYYYTNGNFKRGWFSDGTAWKYFDEQTGELKTGWLEWNSKWYLLGNDGNMLTGWQNSNGKWYYLDLLAGNTYTGWRRITVDKHYVVPDITESNEGSWFYFYPDGSLAFNTTIDGLELGSDGTIIN